MVIYEGQEKILALTYYDYDGFIWSAYCAESRISCGTFHLYPVLKLLDRVINLNKYMII